MIERTEVLVPIGFPIHAWQILPRIVGGAIVLEIQKFICDWCERPFKPARSTRKFCDRSCRNAKRRKKES